jgi:hypothetical protein
MGVFNEIVALGLNKGTFITQYKTPRCIKSTLVNLEILYANVLQHLKTNYKFLFFHIMN